MASLVTKEFQGKRVASLRATDYPELREHIGDYTSVFYGPHQCSGCYATVVKTSIEEGAYAWEQQREWVTETPELPGSPRSKAILTYKPHMCSQERFYRKLAGKVLTILDASFPEGSKQAKAIKDLLRKEFREIIDLAARESGHGSGGAVEGGEGEGLC